MALVDTEAEGLDWLSDYLVSALKSPTWVVPIAEFVDDRCNIFDSSEENKLEYTICHIDFKRLIDDLFMAHLLDVSVSPAQFDAFCQHGLASREALHRIFVEQLLSVDDFLTFKAMMVKRNIDLDRKAALEMSREFPSTAAPAAPHAQPLGEPMVGVEHSSGAVSYVQWPMAEGVLAWHDREFGYTGIPEEVLGSILFAGPHKDVPTGALIIRSSHAAKLYLFYENSGHKRNGGFPQRLNYLPEWVKVGGTQMKWGKAGGKEFWVSVWSRSISAGATVEIPIQDTWVGGIAMKLDTGEWRLYEEQEELMRAISGAEGADSSAACSLEPQPGSLSKEIDERYEQAQLEQAIALSLQAEEERLRQIATIGEEATAAADAPAPAPPEAPEETEAAVVESLPPEPAAAATLGEPLLAPPEPVVEAVAAPLAEEPAAVAPVETPVAPVETPAAEPLMTAPPAAAEAPVAATAEVSPRKLQAPKELPPVMPRMVRLKPLVAAPQVARPGTADGMSSAGSAGTLDRLQAEAVIKRERAARAIETGDSAAAASTEAPPEAPPAFATPTEEERRQRAEHLKRQRELILQKRKAERQQQLMEHATRGKTAAVDKALGAVNASASGVAVTDLIAPGEVAPDTAEAAVKMRQALTLQLRQTLEHGKSEEQISQLEQMKSG